MLKRATRRNAFQNCATVCRAVSRYGDEAIYLLSQLRLPLIVDRLRGYRAKETVGPGHVAGKSRSNCSMKNRPARAVLRRQPERGCDRVQSRELGTQR
jgi:hypothetical protein